MLGTYSIFGLIAIMWPESKDHTYAKIFSKRVVILWQNIFFLRRILTRAQYKFVSIYLFVKK